MDKDKTHYRKAFNSPYLSSADIVGETSLTIAKVVLEPDKTKKTQNNFNTAYFTVKEIRDGEPLKPMIFNAGNSKTMHKITGSHFIDDWNNINVVVYVDPNVKNRGEIVEGLRIKAVPNRPEVTPANERTWSRAKGVYKRDGNFKEVLKHANMSPENQAKAIKECKNENPV